MVCFSILCVIIGPVLGALWFNINPGFCGACDSCNNKKCKMLQRLLLILPISGLILFLYGITELGLLAWYHM